MAGAPSARAARPPLMRRRTLLQTLGILAASTALIWSVTALALVLLSRGARAPRTQELVIPPGTAAEVGRGEDPVDIPAGLSFVAGDVLVVRNEDRAVHLIGSYAVPPGGSTRIVLQPTGAGAFFCTLHPSGLFSLDVQPRGLDLRLTLLPTLLLGPALGLAVAVALHVASRLDTE